MTLVIEQIHSATEQEDGTVLFITTSSGIPDVHSYILGGEKNADNDEKLRNWLLRNTPDPYVETRDLEELERQKRRGERDNVFQHTIDNINPLWYETLSTQMKSDLAAWRAAWLNYPSTGVKPSIKSVEEFFNMWHDEGDD